MHFNQLRAYMRPLLDSGVSLELISAPGRGKSEFVAQTVIAESARDGEDWGFQTLFLATQTPPDLIGYIMRGERDFGHGVVPVSEPTLPSWMLTNKGRPVWEHKRGVLFLDEYGQGEADVKRASAELLLNRKLGPWALPDGWSVIAASNRSSDRSGVTKSFDFVINRRMEIHITDDLQSWEDWAFRSGVDPLFISFANAHPHIVFAEGVPDKQGPWCTPRSLVLLSRVLDPMRDDTGKLPVDSAAVEFAGGLIGQAAAAALFAHLRLGAEMPDYADITAKPDKVKVPGKPDAQMLVTYNLAARVTEKDVAAVITYMERMPKEFAVTFAKAACRRDPTLIYTDAFEKWANRNASLMTAIVTAA